VLWSWLLLAVALVPAGIGSAGMACGRSKIDRSIAAGLVDPSVVDRIREEGYRAAESCVPMGGVFAAPALLVALAALAAAYALRTRTRRPAPGTGEDH
jgi:hypothetical protein